MPRHVYKDLAIFQLGHQETFTLPCMSEPTVPLITVADPRIFVVDVRAVEATKVIALLQTEELRTVVFRVPRRSPLSSGEVPRVCLDLYIPDEMSDIDIVMLMRQKRSSLPCDLFFGFRSRQRRTYIGNFLCSRPTSLLDIVLTVGCHLSLQSRRLHDR